MKTTQIRNNGKHLGNELNVIKLLTAFTKCVLSRHVFVTLNRLFLTKRLPKMCLEHNHLREQYCQILLLFSRYYFLERFQFEIILPRQVFSRREQLPPELALVLVQVPVPVFWVLLPVLKIGFYQSMVMANIS